MTEESNLAAAAIPVRKSRICGTIAGPALVYLCTTDCFKPEKALGLVFLCRRAASSTLNVPYSAAPFWSSSTRRSCCLIGFSTHKGRPPGHRGLANTEKPWCSHRFMRRGAAYVVRVRICTSHELRRAGATPRKGNRGFLHLRLIGGGSYRRIYASSIIVFPVSRHTHARANLYTN